MKTKYETYYYDYLDGLRESGVTNMYGAAPYLIEVYPNLSMNEAIKILQDWMSTFDVRHS